MILVDTSVWIDHLRGIANAETGYLNREMSRQRFGLTDLILCEVLQGARKEEVADRLRLELLEFEVFAGSTTGLAIASARNYRIIRSKGSTVRKTIDCLIATFCLEHGHTLLHRDRDFDAFEQHLGLRVIRPEQQ